MKSLVWQGPQKMAVEPRPQPTAGPGAVIVRVGSAGICGSEIEGYLGKMGNRTPPLVMGHEFAGTVVELGSGVSGRWSGKKVTVNPLIPCTECPMCRAGMENICPNRTMLGIQHPGGFAEYVAVPESRLSEVPDDLDISAAALAEPLANGVHVAQLAVSHGPVEHAVVLGAGTIGLMCLQALLLSGVPDVSVVELHEGRREHAKRLGSHATFSSGEEAEEHLGGSTEGLGADVAVDAVGAASTRQLGASLVRPGGTVVMIGLREDETSIGFHDVIRNQISLQGSYAYTRNDFEQAVAWISSGAAGTEEVSPPLPLERGPEAFADLASGPSEKVKVFLAEPENG